MPRVERDKRTTGFEHTKLHDSGVDAAGQADAHALFGMESSSEQSVGDAVGAAVDLAVGKVRVTANESGGVGGVGGMPLEGPVQKLGGVGCHDGGLYCPG
jgi:hypothetical protein